MDDAAGQLPSILNRDVRVAAVYGHAECGSRIGNQNTDRAEADDTELLALDLLACELTLAFLDELRNVLIILDRLYPVDTAEDVAGRQEKTCHHELLHAVRVSAGRVEHYDTFLSQLVKRDIVNAGACSCNGKELVAELHLMHSGAAHKRYVGIRKIVGLLISSAELIQTDLCDRIQAIIFHF